MPEPTPAQETLIRYFAGDTPRGQRSAAVRTTVGTYRVCKRKGWIEETDEFPFHRATPAGRLAVGLDAAVVDLAAHQRIRRLARGVQNLCDNGGHQVDAARALQILTEVEAAVAASRSAIEKLTEEN